MAKGPQTKYATFTAGTTADALPHPRDAAWWGSRLFLSWVSPLMALGQRKQLSADDIWSLPRQLQSKVVSAKFMAFFDTSRSIPRAFVQLFGWHFLATGIASLVALLASLLGPVVPNRVVSSLTNATFSLEDVSVWVLVLFAAQVVQTLVDTYVNSESQLIAIEFVGCLKSLLYSKTMRLSAPSRREKSTGDITNMYTSDSEAILSVSTSFHELWVLPLQISIVSYMLYSILNVAAFAGIGIIIIMLMINQAISKRWFRVQRVYRSSKDVRMKKVAEVFKAISIVKYNAWEDKYLEGIEATRAQELKDLLLFDLYSCASIVLMWGMPVFISIASFGVYSVVLQRELTPAAVFTSLALFQLTQGPLRDIPDTITMVIQSKVALERVAEFLDMPEIDETNVLAVTDPRAATYSRNRVIVSVENASFGWDPVNTVLRDVNLEIKAGDFYVFHGTVGCGKSSLCSALLGEMVKHNGAVYVVRDNIIFGQPFDRKKYNKIVDACALSQDLQSLPAGDLTEIGERGVNLSGGQKARIALARACYSDASIYLLDSPLSAVDAITILLVAHNPEIIASEHVTHAVTIDERGALVETRKTLARPSHRPLLSPLPAHSFVGRSYEDAAANVDTAMACQSDSQEVAQLNREMALASPFKEPATMIFSSTETGAYPDDDTFAAPPQSAAKTEEQGAAEKGKLIHDEVRSAGRVGRHVFAAYYRAVGGFPVVAAILLSQVLWQVLQVSSDFWLGSWSSDSDRVSATATANGEAASPDLSTAYRLGVYSALGLASAFIVVLRTLMVTYFGLRAAKSMFGRMTRSLMHAPMRFFDATPIGRILTRYTSDVGMVDTAVPFSFGTLFAHVFSVGSSAITAAVDIQWKGLFLLPVVYLYSSFGSFYIQPAREVKRLTRTAQAPVLNHLAESVDDGSVLRAFGPGQLERFKASNFQKLDDANKIRYAQLSVSQWFSLRIQLLGSALVLIVTGSPVLLHDELSAAVIGLAFSYALKISQNLEKIVQALARIETIMVSPERVQEYIEIPQVAPSRISSVDPPRHLAWPSIGSIAFDRVSFRYKESDRLVLRELTFHIGGGQKIGIVGRTGAGKSSLTMALFRINELAGGTVSIDGVNVAKLGLTTLREKLSMIPQNPGLFKGPLRGYLDPFNAYSDDELWRSIHSVGLSDRISNDSEKLECAVEENGENFSVGERQMLCMARALLRRSRIVIFDEATAAINRETDQKLQRVVREAFADSTVLTIAHRLDTVLDSDHILVLERGEVVEFAPPVELVKKGSGHFFELMQEGGYLDKFLQNRADGAVQEDRASAQ